MTDPDALLASAESEQPTTTRNKKLTPLFQAMNAAWYERQRLIKRIEEKAQRPFLSYVAGVNAPISRDDVIAFADLLHRIPEGPLDMMLHTPGGDVNVAEKLMLMVRERIGNAFLRVIVPDFAKSAGTLMALAANSIVMSDSSELGPIDPQIVRRDVNGNLMQHSVNTYLDAYQEYHDRLLKNHGDAPARIMLEKMDPETVHHLRAVHRRARECAERFLKSWMFNKGAELPEGKWSTTAGVLLDIKRWPSHGQMISATDAQSTDLDLVVEYLEPDNEWWQMCWQLYCLERVAITDREDRKKLFESNYVCLPFGGSADES